MLYVSVGKVGLVRSWKQGGFLHSVGSNSFGNLEKDGLADAPSKHLHGFRNSSNAPLSFLCVTVDAVGVTIRSIDFLRLPRRKFFAKDRLHFSSDGNNL